jgi:2,3-bisphosphoglycerate-independent phosphoglycerate mutase
MTEYEKNLDAVAAFTPLEVMAPLARIVSDANLRQLHIAETEKYAHVTYFFNGGREKPYPNEERILVPSLPAAHFDDVPEMKAPEITARTLEELSREDFILVNFANTDMVGHTGNLQAAVRAVEAVDRALGELYQGVTSRDGVLVVTGDHGNVEAKQNLVSGEAMSEHSINPVPFYIVGKDFRLDKIRTASEVIKQKREVGGILTDVAPTVLELLGLKKSPEMTGSSLLPTLIQQHFGHG